MKQSYVNIEKLHIVRLSGGLGNQMFQYAFYRKLQSLGMQVKMDDVTEYQERETREKQLEVFGIHYETCTREELIALTDAYMDPLSRMRRKFTGRRTKSYMERQFNYDPEVFQQKAAYYEGCWQTERYFADITKELREAFTFRCEITKDTQQWLEQITAEPNAVSIHIRRGDYLAGPQVPVYGNICTETYYEKAIEKMDQQVTGAVYYIFTNDPGWAKEHYDSERFHVVDCNEEATGYLDMLLMSRCRHHIIANSSFSWWGAWLNPREEKIVIAPSKWLNGRDCKDIYTSQMQIV